MKDIPGGGQMKEFEVILVFFRGLRRFVSHITLKDQKGEEYQQMMPPLISVRLVSSDLLLTVRNEAMAVTRSKLALLSFPLYRM